MGKKGKNNKVSMISVIVVMAIAITLVTGLNGWTGKENREGERTNIFEDFASKSKRPSNLQETGKESPQDLAQMLEVPAIDEDDDVMIIRHYAYTLAYHKEYKTPKWVAWTLTAKRMEGRIKRGDEFIPDPQIPTRYQSVHGDYIQSGYDRGHMVPAGDMKWDKRAMDEAFYMSNMCPQAPNLNRGDWRILEEKCRVWAQKVGDLYMVCGPIVEEGKWHKRIGRNKVTVPDGFFKVVMTLADERPRALGFLFPNDDCNAPLKDYAVSVDSVEAVTGIDFFATLPDDIEERIEKMYQFDNKNISK